jgi:hypothetical protein
MRYTAQYFTDAEWTGLRASYVKYGSGPQFWDAYQVLLRSACRRTDDPENRVANELARVAVQLGATEKALFV